MQPSNQEGLISPIPGLKRRGFAAQLVKQLQPGDEVFGVTGFAGGRICRVCVCS